MNGLFTVMVIVVGAVDAKAWTPPENPEPKVIFREMQVDAREGRHALALDKYVWYHEHAVEFDESARRTRLGTALGYWARFGERYPPALNKLKEVRDAALERVKMDQDLSQSFEDLAAINDRLRELRHTKDAFLWLHEHNQAAAQGVFKFAWRALTETGEYKLYGQYERPSSRQSKIAYFHQVQVRQADRDPEHRANRLRVAKDILTHDAALLVACLVIAGREVDAKRTVKRLRPLSESSAYHDSLDRALAGKVPPSLFPPAKSE